MVRQQEFWLDLNLNGSQLVNAKVESVTALPAFAAGDEGRIIYVSTGADKGFHFNDGTAWVAVADASVVSALKTAVGDSSSGLVKDVKTNSDAIAEIEEQLGMGATGSGTSVSGRVEALETAVGESTEDADGTGSIYARIAANRAAAAAAQNTASQGVTDAAAAQKIADAAKTTAEANTTAIGSTSDAAGAATVYGAIKTNAADIAALKTAVGDGADGLAAKVAQNTSDIAAVKATADAAAVKTDVDSALANKVDKVEGKSLVSDTEIAKLATVAEGAQVNVIETVKVNSTALSVEGKAVNIDLSSYALKTDVSSAVSSAYVFKGSKTMAEISALGDADKVAGYVYNVTDAFTSNGKNYPAGTNVAWTGTEWDPLSGYTDFSIYAVKTDVDTALAGKQDSLSETQLAAVDSGITSAKVAAYDGYAATIASKVDKNADITAGTYTKVTVDAKGLVTAGAAITAADVPELDAAKITTGTFDAARIPTLDIAAKTSGTLAADRVGIGMEEVTVTAAESVTPTFSTLSGVWMATVTNTAGEQVICGVTYTTNGVTLAFGENASGSFKVRAIGPKA